MNKTVIDYYFKCPKFIELLDTLREKYDLDDSGALALNISNVLKLHDSNTRIISNYLKTGTYDTLEPKTPISIIDWGNKKAFPSKQPSKLFEWTTNILIEPNSNSHDGLGVSINLNDDTTQDELKSFIMDHWSEIKSSLDDNFPNRLKRSVKIRGLNNQLDIAEQIFCHDDNHNNDTSLAFLEADLAADMDMEISDVRKYAKRFEPLMKLKHNKN